MCWGAQQELKFKMIQIRCLFLGLTHYYLPMYMNMPWHLSISRLIDCGLGTPYIDINLGQYLAQLMAWCLLA